MDDATLIQSLTTSLDRLSQELAVQKANMRGANDDVIFVNEVLGRGHLNQVVNISFGTHLFTPTKDGAIDADTAVSCRLRMDINCAVQLHATLGSLLGDIAKMRADAEEKRAAAVNGAGLVPAGAETDAPEDSAAAEAGRPH